MPWWAWVLIVIGVAALGFVKLRVFKRWMDRRKEALKRASEE